MQKLDYVFFPVPAAYSPSTYSADDAFRGLPRLHQTGTRHTLPHLPMDQVTVQMLAVQQHLPLHCVSQSELGQLGQLGKILRQFLNGFPLLRCERKCE